MCSNEKITVCIPVYKAGKFLAQTLNSVLAQTYRDFKIEISVDYSDDDNSGKSTDSWRVLKQYSSNPSISIVQNSTRLGWDRNVKSLLSKITTPYYAILPHDDIWHPRYLETFMTALSKYPEYGVAYGDLQTWGLQLKHTWRHAVELPETGDRRKQLYYFLLQGAEAMPWRGLTRSELLAKIKGFPVDEYRGFAVECEYAMSLILSSSVIYIPQTLYYKQIYHSGRVSASKFRIADRNAKQLQMAWLNHKVRMEKLLCKGLSDLHQSTHEKELDDYLLLAALSVSTLFRIPEIPLKDYLYFEEINRIKKIMETLPNSSKLVKKLKAKFHYFLWQNAVASNDRMESLYHLKQAVDYNWKDADVCFAVASELERAGSYLESLYWLEETNKMFPNRRGIVELRQKIYKRLKWYTGFSIKNISTDNAKILLNKVLNKIK